MGSIVWAVQVSADGYFEGPDGDLSWHQVDDELHDHVNAVLGAMSAFLDGRITYELMADFWSTADQDPQCTPTMAAFAEIWRRMPKLVYSRTLTAAGPNTRVVREIVPGEVEALLSASDGDLAVGGAELAGAFWRLGLLDQLWLYVHPVVVGGGRRPFGVADASESLRLLGSRTFGNGVVLLRYAIGTHLVGP